MTVLKDSNGANLKLNTTVLTVAAPMGYEKININKSGSITLSNLIVPCEKNLFDINAITKNVFYSNGELKPNAMVYALSDFMPVEEGVQYYHAIGGGIVNFFNSNKEYITGGWVNFPYIIPSGYAYIRVQVNSEAEAKTFMFGKGEYAPPGYYPYECYTINEELLKDLGSSSYKSPLDGLTINFVGDSITNQETFIRYIASNYNVNPQKYAANGLTLQANQIVGGTSSCLSSADKNADGIVILGGTNDAHYITANGEGTYKFGSIGDTTTESFCGAVDVMCRYLLSNFKGKRILICSPMTRDDTINGKSMRAVLENYVNAEKQIVESYGLPFLDLFHNYAHYHYSTDGLHPSQQGGNLYGRVIAKKLEDM